jgi:hypothetical protein
MDVRASPILSCPLRLANTNCTGIRAPLIGEAWQINKNPLNQLIGAANVPCFANRRGEHAPLRLSAQGETQRYLY